MEMRMVIRMRRMHTQGCLFMVAVTATARCSVQPAHCRCGGEIDLDQRFKGYTLHSVYGKVFVWFIGVYMYVHLRYMEVMYPLPTVFTWPCEHRKGALNLIFTQAGI